MKVRVASQKEWEDFVDQSPRATFFHTYDWYSLWSQYGDYTFEARIFEFEGKPRALLPLLIGRALKGLIQTYTSSPAGTYGGYLYQANITDLEKKELAFYLKKLPILSLYQNPFNQKIEEDIRWNKKDFTQVLDLQKGWDSIWSNWTKGHASAAKKGIREGLVIKIAEQEDWQAYFDLYQETIQRWKEGPLSQYSWSFFERLQLLSPHRCRLWLAWNDKKPIAGCLCFYLNQHVVYWHGASSQIDTQLRPMQTLQYHIIKGAIAEGFHWYDFNPSANIEGVIRFKKGFGAIRLDRAILEKEPWGYRLLSQLYQKLRRQ